MGSGAGLGKRGASPEPAACKPLHRALAGTYPRPCLPALRPSSRSLPGCELRVRLQLDVRRADSPALCLGKGKRRVNCRSHPAFSKSHSFLHEDGDLSPCRDISPGAQRSLGTCSQQLQEQSLLKQDSCNQLVPTVLGPPAPRTPGRQLVEPEEPRAQCQTSSCAQDTREPVSPKQDRNGSKSG